MGWLEFSVIIGCGLFGFMVVNAVIDARRSRAAKEAQDHSRQSEMDAAQPFWWETLNVDRNASPDQVKTAFRREISKYHPDRVEGLGVELRELADRKAKEVNRAYKLAKEDRGFS
jgi:DnaJ-class molecular chaperone